MKKTFLYCSLLGLVMFFCGLGCIEAMAAGTVSGGAPGWNPSEIRITGRGVDSDEKPVPGAVVYLRFHDVEPFTTGDDGRFEFTLEEERYSSRLFLYAEVPESDLIGWGIISADITDAMPEREPIIKVEHGRRFFGVVLDENGDPVEGALVGAGGR